MEPFRECIIFSSLTKVCSSGMFLVSKVSECPEPELPVLRHVYVLTAALFSSVLFDASSLSAAIGAAGAMLGLGHLPMWDGGTLYYLHSYAPVLLAAAVGSTPLPAVLCRRMASGRAGRVLDALEPIALLALLAVCTAFLVSGSANPFLYFRF